MTRFPGHWPSAPACSCRELGVDIVDIECAAVWTVTPDGYRPVSNPTQNGIGLGMIGFHRAAQPGDRDATKGALVGSFLGDGHPVDTIRYPHTADPFCPISDGPVSRCDHKHRSYP